MAFHIRKVLKEIEKDDEYCSSCDKCPYYCNLAPPPPHPKHQINTILILSLCILGAGFLFLTYFAIRRFRSRNRMNSPPPNTIFREDIVDELHGAAIDHPIWYIRTVGLPQSTIDSIHKFNYKTGEGLIEGSDCSVCLSEFEEDESLRLLPKCSHAFHVTCIDTWLRSHQNCPVCRAPVMIVTSDGESSEGTSSGNSESTVEIDEVDVRETGDQMGRERRFRVVSDLADHRVKVDQELRRSVSLDLSSASRVYEAVANVHGRKDEGPCGNNALVQGQI
ncbi:hypothetical protein ACS0TY_028780 [Phlomoides rotata]